jgi:aspartyl-tRNA(Asn)/glutamyl-tRNA(Gln) amidotransferase subunit A
MTETPDDTPGDDRSEAIRRIARELGFPADEETIDHCLDAVDELEATASTLTGPPGDREPVGSRGEDDYNAFLAVYDEPRRERSSGPLAGLSVAVKDNIAVEGLTMTCGSSDFSLVPSSDAVVVERLLDGGAAVPGKTNMDALAFGPSGEFSDFGRVLNPHDAERVPGGSSSGSGAAVAAGLVDAALGSDTGGSIRMPAACCGVVGAKPSHRLVPRDGFVDFAPSLDVVGPLARDVETAARVLDVLAGYDSRDPSSSRVAVGSLVDDLDDPPALTVGLPDVFFEKSTDRVARVVRDVAATLDARGDVETRDVSVDLGEIQNAYFLTATTEFAWVYRQTGVVRGQGTGYGEELRTAFEAMREDGLGSDHVAWRVLPSAYLDEAGDGRAYAAARREVARFERHLADLFEDVDLLLLPTIRDVPPEYGRMDSSTELMNLLGNTGPFNLTGMPGVSVPVGRVDDLPVGAQVVAPVFDDARALQGARLVESVAAFEA